MRLVIRSTAVIAALVCLSLAFATARRAADGVSMPYDMDHFREVASAQAIADGNLLRDPYYRGETNWYNPLLGITVALVGRLTGMSIAAAYVQAGPFLTAAVQFAFFLMAARLVGLWPAAIALAALLYAPTADPSWATPTVTLWLFPNNFAAAFLYAGLAACWRAIERDRLGWWTLVGALLGLTFLAHTAPAVILGLCAVTSVLLAGREQAWLTRRRLIALAVVLGTAIVVSAPLLVSIAGHYHLRIANSDPLTWVWDEIALDHVGPLLRRGFLSWIGLLRLVGFAVLVRRARVDRGAAIVVTWTTAAAVLFVYGWVQQSLGAGRVPALIPQHHFYLLLSAAGYVLAGAGAWAAVTTIVDGALSRGWALVRSRRGTLSATPSLALSAAIAAAGIPLFVATNLETMQRRGDFDEYRREALGYSKEFAATRLIERLRTQTPVDAVVLATDLDSYYRVAPAGRRVVSIPAIQSNPYITQGNRDADQEQMLRALLAGDGPVFDALADTYSITHVLLGPADSVAFDARKAEWPEIRELSRQGGFTLYERRAHADRRG